MSYLPFVVIVVVLGIWYANYFRSVKAAGGRGNLMQKQHQEEFGLSDGETITSWWSAVCYIGPLMPGGGVPHLGEKLLHALATSNERGAQVHVCATSLGRVGVSMEPLDGLERSAAIASPAPSSSPSRLPSSPSSAHSPSTNWRRSAAVMPSTPSSAKVGVRCATDSEITENTRKAPTNSATRASTVRFTR